MTSGGTDRLMDNERMNTGSSIGKPLRIHWFRRGGGKAAGNFGDELGPLVVSHILQRPVEWAEPENCDLASIGSILSQVSKAANRVNRSSELMVWGSGLMEEDIDRLHGCINPLAVRGVNTRRALGLRDDLPLGDPGILSDLLIEPQEKKHIWGVVPHFSHRNSPKIREVIRDNNCLLIDPTSPVLDVLKAISSCRGIVSSSLHGLIVADSFRVPCYWLDIKSHKSHEYKFADYSSGFDRNIFPRLELDEIGSLVSGEPDISPFIVSDSNKTALVNALKAAF
ncbi:polysaccharide pyruvyl transferase family protein [Paracoccus methylarcula]|uniref:Polysaccharide pyruvyl transferase family protein n=1 Tax=Paracoccus methylarcula TaxID=72022 RepID=A0A422QVN3_9RHOB|nr:polysaccharide pyruvyl transferase family protein [Paracoccus methylarcula]RNF34019.1 polysaccharide pyruvyl transferase family protein [Paracoccus methylarcula]